MPKPMSTEADFPGTTDLLSDGTPFWRSGYFSRSAVPVHEAGQELDCDLVTFLGAAQEFKVDFLPVTWQPGLDNVGEGATAEIREALIDLQMSFAFKRFKHPGKDDKRTLRELTCELLVLGQGPIKTHPNIVRLEGVCWDIGSDDSEVWPVLLFEKTPFGDLENFAESEAGKGMSLIDRLRICIDIGTALRDLHSQGIIHGDLGPRNVLIFHDSLSNPVAKVTDFGYSTLACGGSGTVIRMPRTKPWYAPEWHHRGFSVSSAMKMDIFSFGMLCFWLLFNDLGSFPGLDSLECTKFTETLLDSTAVFVEKAEMFSEAQKRCLHIFFQSTLQINPGSRCTDLTLLLHLLRLHRHEPNPPVAITFQGGSQIHNQAMSTILHDDLFFHSNFKISRSIYQLYFCDYRVRRHIRRMLERRLADQAHKIGPDKYVQNAAFQLAFCYHVGFGVQRDVVKSQHFLERSGEPTQTLTAVVDELSTKSNSLNFRDGTFRRMFRLGHMTEIDFDRHYGNDGQVADVECEYRREILDLQTVLGKEHTLVMIVRSRLSRILNAHGLWAKSEELCEQILEQSLKIYGREDENTVSSMEGLSAVHSNQGRYEEAAKLEMEIMNISTNTLGPVHPLTLTRMSNLASSYRELGRWSESEKLFMHVLKAREETLGPENPKTLTSMANLGWLYRYEGRLKDAEQLESRVLSIRKRVLGTEYPDTLSSMTNLACTYLCQNRLEEAENLLSDVMYKIPKNLGLEHPDMLSSISHLAQLFHKRGHWQDAEKLQIQVHQISSRVLGLEHPDTLANMSGLSLTYRSQGRWKEAEELIAQVREARKKAWGENHRDTLSASGFLALTFLDQGRLKEAEELAVQVLAARTETLGGSHPDSLSSMTQLAAIYRDQGRLQEAEDLFTRAMEGYVTVFGSEHNETLANRANLASTYMQKGQYIEAEAEMTQVANIQEKSPGPEHPETLTSKANLMLVKRYLGKLEEAERLGVDVLHASQRILGETHPDTLVSMENLALTYGDRGRWEEAEDLHQKVVQNTVAVLGSQHPDSLTSMSNLAALMLRQERWDEAESLVAPAMQARRQVLGTQHPDTLVSAVQLAQIFKAQGRQEELVKLAAEVETSAK